MVHIHSTTELLVRWAQEAVDVCIMGTTTEVVAEEATTEVAVGATLREEEDRAWCQVEEW